MSERNVEIVGEGYAYFVANGDFQDEIMHPDFVWDMSNFRWPSTQSYAGVEGARVFMTEWLDAWDDWELDLEQLLDAGDMVLAIVRQRGRSKTTGIAVDMRFAQLWTVRDGKQLRMRMYADLDEARQAAGLESD